jgi:hypothetical protein
MWAAAGAYLKLWESADVQREYLQQHMTQGQMHSHWGRVDDEVNLDKAQIEDLLARRTVYHADIVRSDRQQCKRPRSAAAISTEAEGKESSETCQGVSGARAAAGQPAVESQNNASEASRAHVSPAVGHSLQDEANGRTRVELQAAGMSQQEKAAAVREHNRQLLARAGVEAIGRQHQTVDIDSAGERSGNSKRRRAGGTVQKLERMMRKRFARVD